jgi:hypothetical protein
MVTRNNTRKAWFDTEEERPALKQKLLAIGSIRAGGRSRPPPLRPRSFRCHIPRSILACGGSYDRLCSFCFASLQRTVLLLLVGAHFVFLGGLDCSVRAHACSSATFTLCSSASVLHVALLVLCCDFCTHTLLWFCFLPFRSVLNDSMLL